MKHKHLSNNIYFHTQNKIYTSELLAKKIFVPSSCPDVVLVVAPCRRRRILFAMNAEATTIGKRLTNHDTEYVITARIGPRQELLDLRRKQNKLFSIFT